LACEKYELVLAHPDVPNQTIHSLAFTMGQIYQKQSMHDRALTYYGLAIEAGVAEVLFIQPSTLSKFYLHRS